MTTGGGTFQGPTSRIVSTDGNGQASLFWTARTGTIQTATATLPGLAPVTFTGLIGSALAGQARCELTTAGAAYCWGDNRRGQIGDGTLVNRSQATAVSGALTFASLAEGSADHSCGLTAAGQAYCWGANSFGQLGDGSTTDRTAPTPVSGGFTFTQVAVSPYRTCGRTAAGWLICWGWSGADLFGDGVLGVVRSPLQVGAGGVSFASVALGQSNACAVSAGGTIYCWGLGTSGQIGDGQLISRSTPTPLTDGRSYSAVSVGVSHVCGLTVAGAAFCWGNGPLGTGATTSSSTPAPVTGGLTFTSIAASPSGHTCARATTGVAYCWGSTSAGITDVRFGPQLGDGTIIARLVPTAVLSGVSFASVSVRSGFSCGRRSGGQPYCWGANSLGQLGDLTTTVRATPVATRWVEGTAGAPVSLINNGFSTQTLAAGTAVASPPSVLVRDFAGAPVSGVTVTFAVTSGGGVVTAATATTNASGIATVGSWTLGPVAGVNTLTASAPSLPTVVFTATGS